MLFELMNSEGHAGGFFLGGVGVLSRLSPCLATALQRAMENRDILWCGDTSASPCLCCCFMSTRRHVNMQLPWKLQLPLQELLLQ